MTTNKQGTHSRATAFTRRRGFYWNIDCTAGETTLVIDYDGRFRSCELRDPIGKVQDYDCDISKILESEAMKREIGAIGHGERAGEQNRERRAVRRAANKQRRFS